MLGHVQEVEAERLRFIAAQLSIQLKVDPKNIHPQSDLSDRKTEDVQADSTQIFMNIVDTLRISASNLENFIASGK